MFAGLMNNYQSDPMFRQLRSSVYNWMQNPGLSKATMRRLQSQAQARAAADLSSRQRNIATSSARYGLSGMQAEDAKWAARSQSGAGLNNALLNLNLQNEQMAQQNRGRAINAGQSLMNRYYGGLGNMGNAYAAVLTGYNPQVAQTNVYDAMQQVYANPYYGTQSPSVNPYAELLS
jgi:hypothetical protein